MRRGNRVRQSPGLSPHLCGSDRHLMSRSVIGNAELTIEDVEASNNAEASADNVADLATARNRRGGGRKKEDVQNAEDNAADAFDDTDAELLKTVE